MCVCVCVCACVLYYSNIAQCIYHYLLFVDIKHDEVCYLANVCPFTFVVSVTRRVVIVYGVSLHHTGAERSIER